MSDELLDSNDHYVVILNMETFHDFPGLPKRPVANLRRQRPLPGYASIVSQWHNEPR